MTQLFTNNADSTLASGISNSATAMTVAASDGAKFPVLTGSDYFLCTLYQISGINEFGWEIVKVTARTGDVFTIVRAQDGTAASAFSAGDKVSLRMTAAGAGAMVQKASNLSDLASAATARTNLGLGTAATTAATAYATAAQGAKADTALQPANNLSDVAAAATARTNLGLGTVATHALGDLAQTANNLSDLASPSTARTNLGLGTAATHPVGDLAQTANNLSDLASPSTARTNLGLGTLAVQNDSAISATGNMAFTGVAARMLIDGSNATVASRWIAQDKTTNNNTSLSVMPNGAATVAGFMAFGGSDPNNASYAAFGANVGGANTVGVDSNKTGTGVVRDFMFTFAGSEKLRLSTTGIVSLTGSGADTIPALATTPVIGELHCQNAAPNSDYGFMRLSAGGGTALGVRTAIDLQGFGTTDNSQIRFYTAGTERMRISQTGGVRAAVYDRAVRTVSANTTLTASDGMVLVNTSGGNITITLPPANSSGAGFSRSLRVYKTTGDANTVTVAVASGDSIAGVLNGTVLIPSLGGRFLESDGVTAWWNG